MILKNIHRFFAFALFSIAICFVVLMLTSCGENTQKNDDAFSVYYTDGWDSDPEILFFNDNYRVPVEVIDETNGVAKQVVKVMNEGDGDQILSGMNVELDFVNYSMPGIKKDISTWDGDIPTTKLTVFSGDETPNSLSNVLIGLRQNALIVLMTPGWTSDSSQLDKTGENYSIQIIHVKKVYNPILKATGESVSKDKLRSDLPGVILADDGTPDIKIPASFVQPEQTISEQLKIGKGDIINDNDTISFAYTAWKLDGSIIQSTWKDKIPLVAGVNSLNNAWKQTIIGQTIGSQFLIIAKPDESSNTNDDVIYVVDILEKN